MHEAIENVRRLRAETLLDVICQATGVPEKLRGLPLGSHAVEIADGRTNNVFLRTFGRAPRETVCACEVSDAPSLSQALHLLNGETIQKKIVEGTVVREPSGEERAALAASIASAPDRRAGLEDAFWALLNSREFLFQH